MRIYLEHVCHPQTPEWCMQGRNMLTIVRGHYWLCERSLEEPAFLHPRLLKSRVDTLKMRQERLKNVFFVHFEQGIIHRSIVAEINEVSSAILRGRSKVGMLNKAGKRIAWIAGIDPIAIGQ